MLHDVSHNISHKNANEADTSVRTLKGVNERAIEIGEVMDFSFFFRFLPFWNTFNYYLTHNFDFSLTDRWLRAEQLSHSMNFLALCHFFMNVLSRYKKTVENTFDDN